MSRPAAVVVWVLAALAVAFFDTDPLAQAVVLIGAWALLARRRIEGRRLRSLAIGMGVLGTATVALNGLLSHTGATVVVVLPSWLLVAGGPVTAEGFASGASIALGLVTAVSVTAALSVVIEPTDLVDALPGALHHAGAALGAALNLVPVTAASVVAVREAQRLRGWRARGVRAMVDLAVPVLLGAIDRSVQLAESMEARAFGDGRRTRAAGGDRSRALVVLAIAGLAAVAIAGVARALGVADWYAYPVPTVPSVAPLALAPAVLIAALGAVLPPEAQRDVAGATAARSGAR
ncbi:MAG: energy-coupling factor transporter transmembrane component T [Actinomycetota bacterium]|nr:energy-coupling factor transporter transmembrane component T [Actinomycetota bacterium]